MQLKANDILNMYEAIETLSKEKTSMPTAYYIAKNLKTIKEEYTTIEESKQKLINQYGEKNEDGSLKISEQGLVKIDDVSLPIFNEQFGKLINSTIELNIKPISLKSLEQLSLPINTIESLIPLIDDDLDNNSEVVQEATATIENGQLVEIQ